MTQRRKSKLPEANKMARSIRSGTTTGDLAVRYGINSHVIIQTLLASGWDPRTGIYVGDEGNRQLRAENSLTSRAGGAGQSCHHVGGGDNPNVVPTTPRPIRPRVRTAFPWPELPPMEAAPKPEPAPKSSPRLKGRPLNWSDPSRGGRPGKLTPEQRETICERYADAGESSVDLAREYGVNDRTIRKMLRREGIQVRTRSEAVALRHAKRRAEAAAAQAVA